ncbi:MAG: radical SAM protein [Terracidiphilus sp.]|jgi:pyruvate formate lyase activating enzyme
MRSGMVFDIREFTVHDGPGIRTTVFLKGCPLHCSWCHNPEGMSPLTEIIESRSGKRTVGRLYTTEQLASILNRQASILTETGGGVTFSGGEPLAQAAFLSDLIDKLNNVHVLLDTSGYAPARDFDLIVQKCDLVYFDLKLVNREAHLHHTGVDNTPILENLRMLARMNIPFVIRVPLIPGVTDTDENFTAIAQIARQLADLIRIDLLPYNRAAGGKYAALKKEFCPTYDESRQVNVDLAAFEAAGVQARIAGSQPN